MLRKYLAKFKEELMAIPEKLEKSSVQVSSLEECVDTVLNYAVPLHEVGVQGIQGAAEAAIPALSAGYSL